jgi:hypothetical protein
MHSRRATREPLGPQYTRGTQQAGPPLQLCTSVQHRHAQQRLAPTGVEVVERKRDIYQQAHDGHLRQHHGPSLCKPPGQVWLSFFLHTQQQSNACPASSPLSGSSKSASGGSNPGRTSPAALPRRRCHRGAAPVGRAPGLDFRRGATADPAAAELPPGCPGRSTPATTRQRFFGYPGCSHAGVRTHGMRAALHLT